MERQNNQKNEFIARTGIGLFKNVRVLVVAALFVAISIVLGKYISITTGMLRLSFENLTVIMAGFIFGPVVGLMVGLVADFIGCILYGYAINPYILIGAGTIGFTSGLISFVIFRKTFTVGRKYAINLKLLICVFISHGLGSIIIKSYGLYKYYLQDKSFKIVATSRIPSYLAIAICEFLIINTLLNHKEIKKYISKLTFRK